MARERIKAESCTRDMKERESISMVRRKIPATALARRPSGTVTLVYT
ncbi:MAG: hypothetical protein BWY83_02523 [bacterium ADurb.Bin478]|nr:MAG: hypothetical protein BWY83_02523 [bacterium ADurb.Bin478]